MLKFSINKSFYIITISIIVVTSLSLFYRYSIEKTEQQKTLEKTSSILSQKIQGEIEKTLTIQKKIGNFLIAKDSVWHFDLKTARYFEQLDYLIALELAPNGIIKYAEPLKDNFLIIGHDIFSDPPHTELVKKSIKNKTPHFIGPIDLKQGGQGVICRLPIYKNNKFIGFSIAIIDTRKLFSKLNFNMASNAFLTDEYNSISIYNGNCLKQPIFSSKNYNLTLNYCL